MRIRGGGSDAISASLDLLGVWTIRRGLWSKGNHLPPIGPVLGDRFYLLFCPSRVFFGQPEFSPNPLWHILSTILASLYLMTATAGSEPLIPSLIIRPSQGII